MMRMKIGAVIYQKRKEKHVTQQELASFIGVSKASVSKWETEQSYPDISLLPLLAAYFDISIDALMAYDAQLSKMEIQRIYQMLVRSFETRPKEEVLNEIRSFVRRYYACYPFVLQMGMLLLNHLDRLPQGGQQEQRMEYLTEAKELFLHVRHNAKEPELVNQAVKFEAYSLLMLQDTEGVLTLLGEKVPVLFPIESLLAGAFQLKGQQQKAAAIQQSALFQYIAMIMSLLTNYLQLLLEQPEKFKETVEKGLQFAVIFDLAKLHPILLLNFQLGASYGYAAAGQRTELIATLQEFSTLLKQTDFPLQFHGDAYFDLVDDWFSTFAIGNQMPRDTRLVQKDMIRLIQQNPVFDPYRADPEFVVIADTLTTMWKEGTDND